MISITNLDKYFNKNKINEIHVINETTLSFPNKGLVVITGPSGCGKTTLLNVISGLDSAKGEIKFKNINMTSYKSNEWDKLRANNIGFIFQNYYLLEDRTVYDNIKLTLNMIGIVDETDVEYRINYCLNAVGLLKFKKRQASDLSFGQKQRVAIARAIAKNPDVIIADEPTGNLDLKNSVEIMKIIKKISSEKLVILVTHNLNLANNYADRIIKIEDGKVSSDNVNDFTLSSELDYDDNTLYLGDLHKINYHNQIYAYLKDKEEQLDLTIIKLSNQLYLKSNDAKLKINVLDSNSNIKIVDGRKNSDDEIEYQTNFSLDELERNVKPRHRKRNFSFKESLIEALKNIANVGRKRKIQIASLVLLGVMFSISIFTLFSNLIFDESGIFIDENVYYAFESQNNLDEVDGNSFVYYVGFNRGEFSFISGRKGNRLVIETGLPVNALSEKDLIYGRMPLKEEEIVIDASVLDKYYSNSVYYQVNGIYEAKHLLNEKISFMSYSSSALSVVDLVIVGVVNTNTKAWYSMPSLLYNISLRQFYNFEVDDQIINYAFTYSDDIDGILLKTGRWPDSNQAKTEIVLAESVFMMLDSKNISDLERYQNVVIVGTYEDIDETNIVYVNSEVVKRLLDEQLNYYITYLYSLDGSVPNSKFINSRAETVENIKKESAATRASSVSQMIFSIIVSSLIFFFIVRSSLTKRVKELSIFRALGVHKYEIKINFALEYLLISLMTSFIGVVIGTVIIRGLSTSFLGLMTISRVSLLSFVVATLGILFANVIIALIPVSFILRKKPANLLTHFDI